jgi:hypothetical protein
MARVGYRRKSKPPGFFQLASNLLASGLAFDKTDKTDKTDPAR